MHNEVNVSRQSVKFMFAKKSYSKKNNPIRTTVVFGKAERPS